jgi:glyoxylase I family protein
VNVAQFSTSGRAAAVTRSPFMRIKLNSIMVDDQDKALRFYTEVLGFKKSKDTPVGGPYRWITVVSAEGPDDLELALEPNANPAGKTFQTALFEQGIPATAFESSDIAAEYDKLTGRGVAFTRPPTKAGPMTIAVFSDTCGNLIQIYQPT